MMRKTTRQPRLTSTAANANEAPVRVLLVAHNHPRFFPGGTEIFAHHLFKELKKTGCETYFLAATGSVSTVPHPGAGLQAVQYPGEVSPADEWLFWGDNFDYFLQSQRIPEFLFRDFAELLEQLRPDVVHFHHAMRVGLEALKVVKRVLPRAKIVYTLHDFIAICNRDGQMVRRTDESLCSQATPARCQQCFPERTAAQFKLREQWIKTHFDLVDQFLSPSHFLANRYVEWGIPASRMAVMANGHPRGDANLEPRETLRPRNRFGFFGQISPYKGTLVLLEAARLLLEEEFEDFHVDIHGNIGLQLTAFKERFQEMLEEVKTHVTFHGSYRREEMGTLMDAVDWTVVSSVWWENAPLVIGEAHLYGRPVIASDIGGMAEHVKHGIDGLHFRAGSARALADAIKRAATEPELWDTLVSNIVPPVSLEDCAARHTELYRTLLAQP